MGCEAATIAWELFAHDAPPDAAPPMTLMGIFSTWTYLTANNNKDNFLGGWYGSHMTTSPPDASLNAMLGLVILTWAAWAVGVMGIMKNKGKAKVAGDAAPEPAA